MSLSPHSPRRQRRAVYDADSFARRRRMTVPLSRELRGRFHRRSLPVRKGDTVLVMRGSFVGREERVAKVDRRGYSVTLDNVTLKSGEEKLKPLPIRTNHLLLVRLNLADAWRREALKVREEDLTPAERGEAPEAADVELPSPAGPAAPIPETPDRADDDDDAEEPDAEDSADAPTAPAEPAPPPAKAKRGRSGTRPTPAEEGSA